MKRRIKLALYATTAACALFAAGAGTSLYILLTHGEYLGAAGMRLSAHLIGGGKDPVVEETGFILTAPIGVEPAEAAKPKPAPTSHEKVRGKSR